MRSTDVSTVLRPGSLLDLPGQPPQPVPESQPVIKQSTSASPGRDVDASFGRARDAVPVAGCRLPAIGRPTFQYVSNVVDSDARLRLGRSNSRQTFVGVGSRFIGTRRRDNASLGIGAVPP